MAGSGIGVDDSVGVGGFGSASGFGSLAGYSAMSQTSGGPSASVNLDTSGFDKAMARVAGSASILKQVGDTGTQSLLSVQKQAETTAESVNKVISSTNTLWESMKQGVSVTNDFFRGASWDNFVQGGLRAAQNIKQIDLMFNIMSGSQEKANQNMASLEKLAAKTGEPITRLKEGASSLLPVIKGTNADLGQLFSVAQRLGTLDPMQGTAGAAFALREFMSGEYLSLVRRFEMPRQKLIEIKNQAGGDSAKMVEGLAKLIDQMGLTEEKAAEMGRSGAYAFDKLNDEINRLNAMTFTPLLNDVILPAVKAFGDLVQAIRNLSPELTGIIGKTAGILGLGSALKKLPFGIGGSAAAQTLGGAVTGAAAGAVGGIEIGTGLVRGLGQIGVGGGFAQFKDKSQEEAKDILGNTLKQIAVVLFDAFMGFVKGIMEMFIRAKNGLELIGTYLSEGAALVKKGIADLITAIGGAVEAIGEKLNFTEQGKQIQAMGGGIKAAGQAMADDANNQLSAARERREKILSGQDLQKQLDALELAYQIARKQQLEMLMKTLGLNQPTAATGPISKSAESNAPGELTKEEKKFFDESQKLDKEEQDAKTKNQQEGAQARYDLMLGELRIEKERADKITEIEENFSEQTKQIAADRTKMLTREAEDETDRRAQVLKGRQSQIDGIHKATAEKEADSFAQLAEQEQGAREQAQKEEIKTVEAHQRQMEQMEKQHRESLLQAAANLDARAVYQQQRQFALQKDNAEQQLRQGTAERRKQLEESIADQRAALTKQNAAQKEQDNKRIAEMQAGWQEQDDLEAKQKEKQDRRRQEDWDQQDKEREKAKDRSIEQVKEQSTKELQALIVANAKKNSEIATSYDKELSIIRSKRAEALKELENFEQKKTDIQLASQRQQLQQMKLQAGAMDTELATQRASERVLPKETAPAPTPTPTTVTSSGTSFLSSIGNIATAFVTSLTGGSGSNSRYYQEGTMDLQPGGKINAHAGEIIVNPMSASRIRDMLGSGATQGHLEAAVARGMGGGGNGLQIGSFAPNININGSNLSKNELAEAVQTGLENMLADAAKRLQQNQGQLAS